MTAEKVLDDAVSQAIRLGDDPAPEGSAVIAWAVVIAYVAPGQLDDEEVTIEYHAPSGQTAFSTVGLLLDASDRLRAT